MHFHLELCSNSENFAMRRQSAQRAVDLIWQRWTLSVLNLPTCRGMLLPSTSSSCAGSCWPRRGEPPSGSVRWWRRQCLSVLWSLLMLLLLFWSCSLSCEPLSGCGLMNKTNKQTIVSRVWWSRSQRRMFGLVLTSLKSRLQCSSTSCSVCLCIKSATDLSLLGITANLGVYFRQCSWRRQLVWRRGYEQFSGRAFDCDGGQVYLRTD